MLHLGMIDVFEWHHFPINRPARFHPDHILTDFRHCEAIALGIVGEGEGGVGAGLKAPEEQGAVVEIFDEEVEALLVFVRDGEIRALGEDVEEAVVHNMGAVYVRGRYTAYCY